VSGRRARVTGLRTAIGAALLSLFALRCAPSASVPAPTAKEGGVSPEAGSADATAESRPNDGAAAAGQADGADDAGPNDATSDAPPTIYSSLSDLAKWSTFDVATLDAGALPFLGAAFDGQYVYLAPGVGSGLTDGSAIQRSLVTRYDTRSSFTTSAAWGTFDLSTVNAKAQAYAGGASDGRYVYFVPLLNNDGADGVVGRYDPEGDFEAGTSWATFDICTLNIRARGCEGATFDGRFLYFAPGQGLAAQYDTRSPFTANASWATFDLGGTSSYAGAAFDGRYVYFIPHANPAIHGSNSSVVARYDTLAQFRTGASWATFDLAAISAGAKDFVGSAFDGRYLYLVPAAIDGVPDGVIARYDTQGSLTAPASWQTLDLARMNAAAEGFFGAAFDGRYIYFVPDANEGPEGDGGVRPDGVIARYDIQAAFDTDAGSAWTTFDVTTIDPAAERFAGAAFDGRYLYLVPTLGVVARFDARTPTALPASYHGSFL
jgi:hypothetical protein